MSSYRKVFASLIVLILIAGHAVVLITHRERWPFSMYPMFSSVSTSNYSEVRLVGVSADGSDVELSGKALAPFGPAGLREVLATAMRYPDTPIARESLEALLDLLNRRQIDREEPEYAGIRTYLYRWSLDPKGPEFFTPEGRELKAEFSLEDN